MKVIEAERAAQIAWTVIMHNVNIDTIGESVSKAVDKCSFEAEPVRHGRWELFGKDKDDTLYGHDCGWRSTARTKYCPNCGAKMDLEEQ